MYTLSMKMGENHNGMIVEEEVEEVDVLSSVQFGWARLIWLGALQRGQMDKAVVKLNPSYRLLQSVQRPRQTGGGGAPG